MKHSKLRIIPLGGLGEVGRNMMVYEYERSILIVDTGLMFPNDDMLGIDYIIPDITYLLDKRDWVKGIIITHGHEDHTGAIRHVLENIQAPVYATPLTRGLIEVKLAKGGLLQRSDLHTVQAGETIHIGPFKVKFYHVCHSIPDAVGLGIETPVGLIVHASDYKFDQTPVDNWPTDYATLAEFSQRGVLALLADSTNVERPGWTPSERVVDAALDQVFAEAPGRIILASFASLISRMQQVANAAQRHNRKLAFVGTSMVDNMRMARKLGYLDLPDDLVVPLEQALALPPERVVIMCTGSQGEPTSIMGRLSRGTNRQFDIIPGDTVVLSSHPIPGNEENVYQTINRLFQLGANVIYEAIAPVHVSGHASQEEMKLLIHLTRPKYLVPIHGEPRHLYRHAILAQQMGIPRENVAILENGQVLEFVNGQMRLGERVPTSYVFVDGSGVGEVDEEVLREREALARDGIVMVHLVLDRFSGSLRREPVITSRGFLTAGDADEVLARARKRVAEVAARANGNLNRDVEQALSNFLYNETRRRPLIYVTSARE
ncbi:MAG: ribonuclease J [Thermanaerothrix sp.]|jgi:ribonuclease J|uniref:Ribonuclease J n=2 Tax=Thermanaerothrix TaxID=1077886 RepID=A0ABU3NQ60_9CHLR|nr:ribonuclease J [Thermanaerothrix sp. 4228-RoL]MDT8898951.1 ribonuclease J [Thermanaerothrix sp. 4228-RoL]